nr:MAG: hypothetical protein 1 [Jiangsu sediment cysto-like virus 1]QYF49683.1 MAG: hypothetical protein 2 [Jiangsu sediment cysto-like virus3]
MAQTFIVPPQGDFSKLKELVDRVGGTLISPKTVREFIKLEGEETFLVAGLNSSSLLVINRHATELLESLPEVILGVPGLIYTSDFYSTASSFPSLDWRELEVKMAKSGHTSTSLDDLAERGLGTVLSDVPKTRVVEDERDVDDADAVSRVDY